MRYAFADINLDIENFADTADDINVIDSLISERVFFRVFALSKAAILLLSNGFEQAAFVLATLAVFPVLQKA